MAEYEGMIKHFQKIQRELSEMKNIDRIEVKLSKNNNKKKKQIRIKRISKDRAEKNIQSTSQKAKMER